MLMALTQQPKRTRLNPHSMMWTKVVLLLSWASSSIGVDQIEDPFIVFDSSFEKIIGRNPQLVLIGEKTNAVGEGPVYDPTSDSFMYTDGNRPTTGLLDEVLQVPASRVVEHSCPLRQRQCIAHDLSTKIVRHPSEHANGQTVTRSGVVFTCETVGRRITAAIPGNMNATFSVVDSYRGKPLNSPNDIVEKKDGTVWFTDPEYGCAKDQFPNPSCPSLPNNVYRLDTEHNEIVPVAGESVGMTMDRPNGLAFSVDESLLYIIDSGAVHTLDEGYVASRPHNITVWEVHNSSPFLLNPRLFADIESDPVGIPDGLRLDKNDNVYVSTGDGVQVFNRNGKLIGKIYLKRQASNLTFGGKDNNILFIVAGPYAYAVILEAEGAVVQ